MTDTVRFICTINGIVGPIPLKYSFGVAETTCLTPGAINISNIYKYCSPEIGRRLYAAYLAGEITSEEDFRHSIENEVI